MTCELNVFNISKQFLDDDNVHKVDLIEELVHDEFNFYSSDNDYEMKNNSETHSCSQDFRIDKWRPIFEELPPNMNAPLTSNVQPPKPELKLLPSHLKYSFLGGNETFPVIILSKFEFTPRKYIT